MDLKKTGYIETLHETLKCGYIVCPATRESITFQYDQLRSKFEVGSWVTFTYKFNVFGQSVAQDIFLDARPPCNVYRLDARNKTYFKYNSIGLCEGIKEIKCRLRH